MSTSPTNPEQVCPNCDGSGKRHPMEVNSFLPCSYCHGTGKVAAKPEIPRRPDNLVDIDKLKAMKPADRPKWQGPHCDNCGQMLLTKAEVMTHLCPAPAPVDQPDELEQLGKCEGSGGDHRVSTLTGQTVEMCVMCGQLKSNLKRTQALVTRERKAAAKEAEDAQRQQTTTWLRNLLDNDEEAMRQLIREKAQYLAALTKGETNGE
jgi:hypothetical protein